jgi:ferredoxin/flavodoxin---NADP+ reductase
MTLTAHDTGGHRLRIAIIGSGPSGCYTAQALVKLAPNAEIVVFDAVPTPFGLVRHGIAPDHQGMKGVTRQFGKLFTHAGAVFIGNVRVGRDLELDLLLSSFDAVVIATGLPRDRTLDLPGADGDNVFGAGQIIHLLNSHPDASLAAHPWLLDRGLGENVAIIGSGNVAIDVARLLLKSAAELTGSDVNDAARDALLTRPIRRVRIFGRGPAANARWDASMLRELAAVEGVAARVDGETISETASPSAELDIAFNSTPVRITPNTISVAPTDGVGEPREYPIDSVITAAGFVPSEFEVDVRQLPEEARSRTFLAGGVESGVLGNLAENRKRGVALARTVLDSVSATGRPGLAALVEALPATATDYAWWQRVDAAEVARARADRVRHKFHTRDALSAAGDGSPDADTPDAR